MCGMSTVINKKEAKRHLAYHVQDRLKKLGKSRYWLARQLETSESQIQSVVEQRSVPSWAFVCNLAEILGVSVEYFQKNPPKSKKHRKMRDPS